MFYYDYPNFKHSGPNIYLLGTEEVPLEIDPTKVFPPSETTLTLAEIVGGMQGTSVLDIGTGSGLLAITAAKTGSKKVWAVDKNPRAIACARKNAEINAVADRVDFEVVDILSLNTERRFDLIISNPPFMPMPTGSRFISPEIQLAIDGGLDGADALIAFAQKAAELVSADGRVVLPIPHFVDYRRLENKLQALYSVHIIREKKIRYWLAEYDQKFVEYIFSLAKRNRVEICRCRRHFITTLQIVECSSVVPHTRAC
jgi:HemK-related putative methylase